MLEPTKYLNLELSIVKVSSEVLRLLRSNSILKYDELYSYLIENISEDIKHVFVPSLSFLFLLGKIKYDIESDSIIFTLENNIR